MNRHIHIDTAAPTAYTDLPAIPAWLGRELELQVFPKGGATGTINHDRVLGDGDDDCVSDTIAEFGIWEPDVTLVLSAAFAGNPDAVFVDIGCHVGYYLALAEAWGLMAIGVDGNRRALELAAVNAPHAGLLEEYVGGDWAAPTLTDDLIVKIDIEGNEIHAVAALDEYLNGQIKVMVMEVSPVFNDGYPDLIQYVIANGYECYAMPEKTNPPPVVGESVFDLLNDTAACEDLHSMTDEQLLAYIDAQTQINVAFVHPTAVWG